jgi:hypothetical protein
MAEPTQTTQTTQIAGTSPGVLTRKDYSTILKFYDERVPPTLKGMRTKAEGVLADKLCTCIKKVKSPKTQKRRGTAYTEPIAIAICNKNIFQNRGLQYRRFKCLGREGPHFVAPRGSTQKLKKTLRNVRFSMKKRGNMSRKTRRVRK